MVDGTEKYRFCSQLLTHAWTCHAAAVLLCPFPNSSGLELETRLCRALETPFPVSCEAEWGPSLAWAMKSVRWHKEKIVRVNISWEVYKFISLNTEWGGFCLFFFSSKCAAISLKSSSPANRISFSIRCLKTFTEMEWNKFVIYEVHRTSSQFVEKSFILLRI